jgi:hypothetical protein
MNATSIKSKKPSKEKIDSSDYLEQKYGKEPPISEKELKQHRWNWH